MALKLSIQQKDELRRLTQAANRRIANATKAYEKKGLNIAPREVVGNYQSKAQWETEKYAISRSTTFETVDQYKARLRMLKAFEHGRPDSKMTITEYTKLQQRKISEAVNTALGQGLNSTFEKKLMKMDAPDLSKFWKKFSVTSSKLGMQYASDAAMIETMEEFFGEDIDRMLEG